MITMRVLTWRKSTYSAGDGNCVEVARGAIATLVRDSKNPQGSWIALSETGWRGLLRGIR